MSLSLHPHGHVHVSVSPHLDSPFLFPALPSAPCLLSQVPEVRGKPVHSAQREYGLHRRVLPLHIFGSHTFVPISWMSKKQTSVSHSSTEPEIISLDAGLRFDGRPALDLWDLIVEVLHETRIRVIKHGETCVRTSVRFVQHPTHSKKTKEISWNDQ